MTTPPLPPQRLQSDHNYRLRTYITRLQDRWLLQWRVLQDEMVLQQRRRLHSPLLELLQATTTLVCVCVCVWVGGWGGGHPTQAKLQTRWQAHMPLNSVLHWKLQSTECYIQSNTYHATKSYIRFSIHRQLRLRLHHTTKESLLLQSCSLQSRRASLYIQRSTAMQLLQRAIYNTGLPNDVQSTHDYTSRSTTSTMP